MKLFSFCR